MRVAFFRWRWGASQELLGEAWLADDGLVTWDERLEPLLGHPVFDARRMRHLDPRDGIDFLRRLPHVFDNAPYLWAALPSA